MFLAATNFRGWLLTHIKRIFRFEPLRPSMRLTDSSLNGGGVL